MQNRIADVGGEPQCRCDVLVYTDTHIDTHISCGALTRALPGAMCTYSTEIPVHVYIHVNIYTFYTMHMY